ncbi:MAG: glycosyltransferase, partial [bacterium]|nr:glycosyltransferase [bacterium]
MRIAQLCSVAHPVGADTSYGIYNQVGNLCDSFVRAGHEVTLFTAGDAKTKAKKQSIVKTNVEDRAPISETEVMWENLETASLCFRNAENFDVIHTHFSLLGCHFSSLVETPTFHSIHSPIAESLKPHLLRYRKEN